MSKDFHPLNDIWDIYNTSLTSALNEGLLENEDSEDSENYVWPSGLNVADPEQNDMKQYVHQRMTEILDQVKSNKAVDPNIVAGYIFRSVIVGMLWQAERHGL